MIYFVGDKMQINTLTRYGMRAVVRLAILTENSDQPVSVKRIAQVENISPKYLELIFSVLKKSNILKATKGKGGGYRLTRPLNKITSLEIIETLGGRIGPVDCAIDENFCDNDPGKCTVSPLWCGLHVQIRDFLKSKTLADILHHHKNRNKTKSKK
jgi:Rrf2 family protein